MLTYEEALAQILNKIAPLAPIDIPLAEAWGQVLAEDVVAPFPLPPFANSAMDGYAVHAEDVRTAFPDHPVVLPIVGEVAAGEASPPTLEPGTALRIMTGAPLPPGADAVVPVEDTEWTDQGVAVKERTAAGRFVRPLGEDVRAGETILSNNTPLTAAAVGLCAAVGQQTVLVHPRPTVAIVSTGNELVEPGQPLEPGQIYNSNAYSLAAQVEEAGGIITQRLHAGDTPDALRAAFDACAGAKILLTSGGVSVGGYDYVKSVFAERGTVDFWQVAIRPGKPLAFGEWGKTLFFGLPGNPVSSVVTFELFVRPALRKMRGLADLTRPTVQAHLLEEVSHEPGRRTFLRALITREDGAYFARPLAGQGSGMLRAMAMANGLIIVPDHVPHLGAGEFATVLLLEDVPSQ